MISPAPPATTSLRGIGVPVLWLLHLALHMVWGWAGWIEPWSFFPLLLLTGNLIVGIWLWRGAGDLIFGLGFMLIVAAHGLVGHALAPTALTSAAMLLGNLLTLYVGLKLFRECSLGHRLLFLASYLLLFVLFIVILPDAEPLFLLGLLGLAGTARNLRLLSFFWALVLAFTVAQPYAWETVVILFFVLVILFSAKTAVPSLTSLVFLGVGLLLLFCVLFPVAVIMMDVNPFNLLQVLQDRDIMQAVGLTALTATLSTLLLAVFTIPLAYALARVEFRGKAALLSLIDIPIVIPQSVAGIALLTVFGKQQILGGFLFEAFGLRFDGTILGILVAQIFVALPFFMKTALAAFEGIPEKYELAARNLGSTSAGAFWRVAMPLAARGVFLGAVIAWARAAGEFGAIFFIAASPETAPVAVYTRFLSVGLAETAPLVSALLIFSLGMFFLLQLAARLLPTLHQSGRRD